MRERERGGGDGGRGEKSLENIHSFSPGFIVPSIDEPGTIRRIRRCFALFADREEFLSLFFFLTPIFRVLVKKISRSVRVYF